MTDETDAVSAGWFAALDPSDRDAVSEAIAEGHDAQSRDSKGVLFKPTDGDGQ